MRRLASSAALALATACLPEDTRPPPAQITVTTSASELTLSGIPSAFTADGYDIFIDRLLVNLGEAEVGGDDDASGCNEYSSPDYTRLFDFKQVYAPQELGLAFATGHCPVGFNVRFPDLLAKLGLGVTEDDHTFMRTPGSDRLATDEGISLYVEGSAVKDGASKHFAWPFRRRIGYRHCATPNEDGTYTSGIDLAVNGRASVNIEIHGEALFRGSALDELAHFEPYALADVDADGEITFDELWQVPIETVHALGLSEPPNPPSLLPDESDQLECADVDGKPVVEKTLGDFAYCHLIKDVARFEGDGLCVTVSGRRRRD